MSLIACGDGQSSFGNACGVPANAKKFFEALAGFPAFAETFAQAAQVSRHLPRRLRRLREAPGIYRDVCAGCASSTAFTETFAQAARGSRHLPRRLRRLREVPGICRDVCAGCAGFPAFAETFAQVARGSRHLPKRLRDSRKRQKDFRETCGAPANAKKFSEAFETRPTAISPTKIGLPGAATGADKTK